MLVEMSCHTSVYGGSEVIRVLCLLEVAKGRVVVLEVVGKRGHGGTWRRRGGSTSVWPGSQGCA